eukprot:TRINITY_DN68298_c0_g1_i1.p1 TRINITY_DN68298_c0_g1~~TRINITY_DN68298_c0_g1_i1.p1  ORF type:complete len:437 (+),score=60.09 TRINITY_DN68298_c0_g1_i1:124-1434(+)
MSLTGSHTTSSASETSPFGIVIGVKNTFLQFEEASSPSDTFIRQQSEPFPPTFSTDAFENDDDACFDSSAASISTHLSSSEPNQSAGEIERVSDETSGLALPGVPCLRNNKTEVLSNGCTEWNGKTVSPPQNTTTEPARKCKKDSTKATPGDAGITTLMIRNLPNKYSQATLLDAFEVRGFLPGAHFDFFYLPIDRLNGANLGYAFVNFVNASLAASFVDAFQGRRMRRFSSRKTIEVMAADIQGYEKNKAHYAWTRVANAVDPQCRPLFLERTTSDSASEAGTPSGVGEVPSSTQLVGQIFATDTTAVSNASLSRMGDAATRVFTPQAASSCFSSVSPSCPKAASPVGSFSVSLEQSIPQLPAIGWPYTQCGSCDTGYLVHGGERWRSPVEQLAIRDSASRNMRAVENCSTSVFSPSSVGMQNMQPFARCDLPAR